MNCKDCRYHQPVESLNDALGECRRRSPGPDRDWPRVESGEDWCGEFERPPVAPYKPPPGMLQQLRQQLAKR